MFIAAVLQTGCTYKKSIYSIAIRPRVFIIINRSINRSMSGNILKFSFGQRIKIGYVYNMLSTATSDFHNSVWGHCFCIILFLLTHWSITVNLLDKQNNRIAFDNYVILSSVGQAECSHLHSRSLHYLADVISRKCVFYLCTPFSSSLYYLVVK